MLTMRSRDSAWSVAQSGSSSVAIKRLAPILMASAFLADVREMATTSSQPRAFDRSKMLVLLVKK